ncbi:hypothetical protein UFOVP215_9 [uncultured Caudovirales phage]|uniref:Uncharacterized protein n=1 Tax=uncultured Caudovirales phage TaxID=2100421 RepID=A0A6J7WQ11_9CAUD|nr:hypothetical protein UFOVP215_9 [uncultured Caudovirales phage]
MKIEIDCFDCEATGISKVTDLTCQSCNGTKTLIGYPEELYTDEQLEYYYRWNDYKNSKK